MAYLKELSNQRPHFLSQTHLLGRIKTANSFVNEPAVSKSHALIEWQKSHWTIRDISKNGTWINQKKINPNSAHALSEGDHILLPGESATEFRVESTAAPCNRLVPINNSKPYRQEILLEDYSLLPSAECPEVAVYFDPKRNGWRLTKFKAVEQIVSTDLEHNQIIKLANTQWQIKLIDHLEETLNFQPSSLTASDLSYRFDLSLDEETTKLQINFLGKRYCLKAFTHHYLLATLARYKARDARAGVNQAAQGWVDVDQLSKDLGINNIHLNIQIHRARKQFLNQLGQCLDTDYLIQREPGKIRFGGQVMQLFKGGMLECELNGERSSRFN
ncbi:MAG: FHA domain-containing protein, partial [Kangiellaceae bacterium]|nr:FHA domain-containing protein [Kangiellaceae bacterium]